MTPAGSEAQLPVAFLSRLEARRPELEQALLTRVYGIADPTGVTDQAYLDGLRRSVSAGIEHALDAIEHERGGGALPIPPELLVQARLAARNGVSLDTVLRRYCAGDAFLADVLVEEAEATRLPRSELKSLLRRLASTLDRLLAAVSEEYSREAQVRPASTEERRATLVDRLLSGDLVDAAELSYPFDSWHLALVSAGPDTAVAAEAMRAIARTLDRALLLVERSGGEVWAWLGGRRPYEVPLPTELLGSPWAPQLAIAIGEPAEGLPGWRLTHRQAAATLPIAQRGESGIAHYAQAPLLASALKDELLATSLRRLYLDPLAEERGGGATAKDTLRAYFAAAGNVSSAAAALGVSRRTVSSRLAVIEERLAVPLDGASAELETALRLDEIEQE